ncbi:MAG: carbon starvation protein A [Desulfitobacteriaceae bacterium]|nr:carbon starvation protein A [Desulfitobacteriaceae bacterium]MDI6913467.1 carbon starvation protein A [Desulfitobacteriaceae bacterium]
MNALVLVVIALIAFIVAYLTYGRWVANKFGLDPTRPTPAHTMEDGIDYVPAKAPVLLGHHFASIAGAAPIVGPITAATFGWIPAFLWIVLGGIFFGAVHDFGSIVASIRHKGKSIGIVINDTMGRTGKLLFNIFAWLTLILVIAVFAIIIAKTFVATPQAGTASILFMVVAVFFGYGVYRKHLPMLVSTIIGVALLFVCIWLGIMYPLKLSFNTWITLEMIYIFAASVMPVWILLQPRDYLNSFLLYGLLAGAVIGLFIYQPAIQMTSYAGFKVGSNYLFPVLFVTIACGALSGFHSLVGSGTTSKQLDKETDARIIGYGGMLIESLLAVVALITAVMLAPDVYKQIMTKGGGAVPVFASGTATFLTTLGIPLATGKVFSSLVVSAFALTSLDTGTRLGRYIFQELFELASNKDAKSETKSSVNNYVATIITIIPGAYLAYSGQGMAIWPIFGAANQLLAALALLAVSVWLAKSGKSSLFTQIPMYFIFAVTLTALALFSITNFQSGHASLAIVAVILFILAIILAVFAIQSLKKPSNPSQTNAKA